MYRRAEMADAGFVYVLINPSMPGLVKIGKTERAPEDRIKELSAATGVPTPFILVYHSHFESCSAAEIYIHTVLEERGYKVASNREFFSAPVQEAIQVVIEAQSAPMQMTEIVVPVSSFDDDDLDPLPSVDAGDDFLESLSVKKNDPNQGLIESLIEQGDNYFFGWGDYLEDHREALKYFQKASKLGSGEASERIGDIL